MNESFNPELELQTIRERNKFGHQNRLEQVEKFKEKLFDQRLNVAKLAVELQNVIFENPNTSLENLIEIVDSRSSEYGLSDDQITQFHEKLQHYVEIHDQIQDILGQYQEQYGSSWEAELFRTMFGTHPTGKVHLNIGPMFLYWDVSRPEDFKVMYVSTLKSTNAYESAEGKLVLEELANKRGARGAFVLPKSPLPDSDIPVGASMSGSLINRAVNSVTGEYVFTHEQRHAIDFMLEPVESLTAFEENLTDLSESSLPQEVHDRIPTLVDNLLESGIRFGRSEILAMFEPADLFYGDWRGWRNFLMMQPLGLLGLAALAITDPKRLKLAKSVPQIDSMLAKGFFSESARRQLPSQFFQLVQTLGATMPNYNYANYFIEVLNGSLRAKTGKSYRIEIEYTFQQREPKFRRQLLEGMVAAEVLGRHIDLNLKETMWLLQNEPFSNWKKLAFRAGDSSCEDYKKTLQEAIKEYKKLGIPIS